MTAGLASIVLYLVMSHQEAEMFPAIYPEFTAPRDLALA
jgi:hypothetical protein